MLATVWDELQSRVGQQGGWRHDEDGVNNGLDSAGPGVVRRPPDPVRTKDPGGGVRVLEVRRDADPVLGHPDRVVLVRHGAERKERWSRVGTVTFSRRSRPALRTTSRSPTSMGTRSSTATAV